MALRRVWQNEGRNQRARSRQESLDCGVVDIADQNRSMHLRELMKSPTYIRLHSPNVEAWEPDIRLQQSSSKWLSQYGLKRLKLTIEQILPTIGFKHSDDYVRSLKKPVSARYANGLFSKVPHKSGTVYNLIATRDKLKLIETQLKQAINTYKKRLEWLSSESRRIFGVIEERSVAVILDVQATSRSQLEIYIQSLVQVIKEQIMFISKFNLIRSAADMICWQDAAVSVTLESIDSAIKWLLKQEKSLEGSSTSTVEAILKAMSDDQIEAVYLYTEGSSSDMSREILRRKAKEYMNPLHVVSMNCCSPSTISALKELAAETKGRFHAFSMLDDDVETLPYTSDREADSDSGTDVGYRPRPKSSSRPSTKIGYGVRRDVMLLWSELDQAREALSQIQALLLEVEQNPKVEVVSQNESPVTSPELLPVVESRSELYMGSKEWLKKNGLHTKKLGFYDFLETVAFKHCDGVVDIPRAPKRASSTDAVIRSKLVNARYCDRFAHVRWKDGRIMHVHISGPMHQEYAQRMLVTLDKYRKRLEWLQQGSRELFGTIIEDKVAILIDTSSSMASRLFIVKDKLYRLMQEQLRHKKKFNIIKFDSKVSPWREHLVSCNDQNLENSWHWVKGLTTGGSTNTLGALKRALADADTEALYLLSDGRPDQPPSTVIAQATLMNSVPVHTISFNCADSEANEFLAQLARETGGRYHYFSEDAQDTSGPRPYESEDIRMIREEIEDGLRDLEKIEKLREECTELDWYGNENACKKNHSLSVNSRKERPISAYESRTSAFVPSPPQTDRPASAQPAFKCRSRQTSSRSSEFTHRSPSISPSRDIPIIHTRSSELRMSFISKRNARDAWMLPESREYLDRRSRTSTVEDNRTKKKKKKKRRPSSKSENGLSPIQRWLKKNSLVARKLTIFDALAPTMIPHTTKYVPILDKHVLSKVFDQVLPLAHTSGSNRTEVQIINPQAVDLTSYEEKLKKSIEEFEAKLSKAVFQSLSDAERLKYETEGIPSFTEHRKSMVADLEENDWPVTLKDIGAIEKEIEQAELYMKQSKELRETSEKLAKESAEKMKTIKESEPSKLTPKPSIQRVSSASRPASAPTYRWSRNQRVIARSELDGFYYPGVVNKSLNSRFLEVDFESGDRQVTPVRYVIATGGSRPCPVLRVGDYVLARASIPRPREGEMFSEPEVCYVPGIVQVTPLREKSAMKCYTVIRFNGKKVTVLRNDMIKISRARFALTCRFIKDAERTAIKGQSPVVVYPLGDKLIEEKEDDKESLASQRTGKSGKHSGGSSPRSVSSKGSRSSGSSKGSRRRSHSPKRSRSSSRSSKRSRSRSRSSKRSRSRSRSSRSGSASSRNSGIDLEFLEQTPGDGAISDNDKPVKKSKKNRAQKKRKGSHSSAGSDKEVASDNERKDADWYEEQEKKLRETQERLEELQKQFENDRELFKKQQLEMEEQQKALQSKQQELLQKQLDDQQEEQRRLQHEQRKLQEQQEDVLRKQKEQQEHLLQQQYNQSQALHLQKQQVLQQEAKRLKDQETETERNQKDQTTETIKPQYRDMHTSPSASLLSLKKDAVSDDEQKNGDETDFNPNKEEGAIGLTDPAAMPESEEPSQMKVFLDNDSEAVLLTKGSHGLLVSRQPPDKDPAVTTKDIPRPLEMGDEVLARWPDDGWYYRGTVRQDCHDSSYFIEDSVGDLERINRREIITDDDDADNIINAEDPVIGLHPNFAYGYAPGIVVAVDNKVSMKVRYFDGQESAVPREELYLISPEKFERDCSYILACEDSLVGQAVVARNDQDGKFYLGSVRERVSGPRNYLIEWADQTLQIQNYAHIFGAHTKRHQLTISNPVLAIADQATFTYLPGKITNTNGQKLVVKFCDGSTSIQVDPIQSFWVSPDYYKHVVSFYRKCSKKTETE